ncbi:hypothetical protein IOD14_28110 [Streptomyces sp. A2-16]|uniref:hypothetical protein n=1 Tax=Streptomyces sp. A2-16 TaxID=2781734 RepID=UPI001BAEB11A|nr:hypothetical protein [Streptomyces sp. A2-16]QUC60306.1 hypothetical protein IOD14_28110 [Streptomyces sp. A2-16]
MADSGAAAEVGLPNRGRRPQRDVVRFGVAQGTQRAAREAGRQVEDGCQVGVLGADGDAEPGSELGESAESTQAHQADQGKLVRQEFAAGLTAECGTNAAPVHMG